MIFRMISVLFLLLAFALTSARASQLVIGMNISDGRTYDPARQADVSTPLTIGNVYETLVTVSSDNYEELKPALASRWESINDGMAFKFYLRENAKFFDGSAVTAHDVKFSIDRLKNLKDQPAEFAANIEEVLAIDDSTVVILVKNPKEPLLPILTTVSFAVYSKAIVESMGGVSGETASTTDSATKHFNNQSFGSGPYRMVSWQRNEQVVLERNPFWHKDFYFDKVIIKHIPDGATQLLSMRNNDIDIAFNLSSEQLDSLARFSKNHRIESVLSLDYVYMALTHNSNFNTALSDVNARLAIAHAIDYDGIIKHLLGDSGIRPLSILPVGIGGVTADLTKKYGYKYDLDKARKFLSLTNTPKGFEFNFSYPTGSILNINARTMVQKIQSDLAKVNIKANLVPMDVSTLITEYRSAKSTATLVSYTIDALEPSLWTRPFVGRIAKRMHWQPSNNLLLLTETAAAESDINKRNNLYLNYQLDFNQSATFINIVQPMYRFAVSNKIKNVDLTAAGWYINLEKLTK